MKMTKHQKEVIRLIKEDGYKLMYQNRFPKSGSWWLTKTPRAGYTHAIDMRSSTVKNLLKLKIIEYKSTDKHGHKYYSLTAVGCCANT